MGQQRLSAEQALQHDWVKLHAPRSKGVQLKEAVGTRLLEYKVKNGLEKAALEVVASHLQVDQVKDLRQAFESLDENGNGKLTLKEIYEGLNRAGMEVSKNDVKEMFAMADADNSGMLDYTEFLAATIDRKRLLTEEVLWTAFNVFDLDGDGVITTSEVASILEKGNISTKMSAQALLEMISKFDKDGDGQLDFQEFMEMVRGSLRQISGPISADGSDLVTNLSSPASSQRSHGISSSALG